MSFNHSSSYFLITFLAVLLIIKPASTIRCFQCSSDEEAKKVDGSGRAIITASNGGAHSSDRSADLCGAYAAFDTKRNTAVDCAGEEALTPGTFCYKSLQQGPRGFVWDGRWRTVTRRCAQVSERGISWGCDFGYLDNGVYWEECYCAEDACNTGTTATIKAGLILAIVAFSSFVHFKQSAW